MNNGSPNTADAPVPPEGTEQAADQAAKQQQPPPAEIQRDGTVASVVDGVTDVAEHRGRHPLDLRVNPQNDTQAGRVTMPTDFWLNCFL